jgi:alpha-beta hydrolase superfamily lysophospholipase
MPIRWFGLNRPWSRRKCIIVSILLLTIILVNALAYVHARAMTHFQTGVTRTGNPETLTTLQKVRVLLTGIDNPRPENQATPESVGLAFAVHRIASSDGLTLEAWHIPCANTKALALMFHGYAACKSQLLREAMALHELGYAVLLVDFRGCGGSSGNETTIGVKEADDVWQAWAYARQTWSELTIVLYGQSMGSAAILRAFSLHPDLQPAAAVLECPFDKLRSTVANRFTAMGLPTFPGADLLLFWGSVQIGVNGYHHNPVDYAKAARCPILLLHGAKDPRVLPEQAEAIFQNLAGDKHYKVFETAGHESLLAVSPEEWKESVAEFLTGRLNVPQ